MGQSDLQMQTRLIPEFLTFENKLLCPHLLAKFMPFRVAGVGLTSH